VFCYAPRQRVTLLLAIQMKITVGQISDICWNTGFWIFLDIGFSSRVKSCGLLLHASEPKELLFSDAVNAIIEITMKHELVNLLIEAPLSVAFDSSGNPKGRAIEKEGSKTRYWYIGPGCAVMVATFYLLRALMDTTSHSEVRLFEGFVSYKKKGSKSNHSRDVQLLREVVQSPKKYRECIYPPKALLMNQEDHLVSSFKVGGMDFGIPPLIMRYVRDTRTVIKL
jgi:hypothetical protein